MSVEYVLGLLVSVGMLGYLIVAMLKPERF
jgi:K+-transporting ATPase KdpF subunit